MALELKTIQASARIINLTTYPPGEGEDRYIYFAKLTLERFDGILYWRVNLNDEENLSDITSMPDLPILGAYHTPGKHRRWALQHSRGCTSKHWKHLYDGVFGLKYDEHTYKKALAKWLIRTNRPLA